MLVSATIDEVLFTCNTHLAARRHVNRMCLAADVPLIESGTAGYLGQVTVIRKVRPKQRFSSSNVVGCY